MTTNRIQLPIKSILLTLVTFALHFITISETKAQFSFAPFPVQAPNIAPASNFTGVTGDFAFADVDGDNDLDVIITGWNPLNIPITELYLNDGVGNYTLVNGTPFTGVGAGSIAFADIDGDNDQDVLITGDINSNNATAELYTNDGSGNFTLVTGTPFSEVFESFIAFADVDGDNDQDVIITGWDSSNIPMTELYTNDGSGNFTLVTGTPFTGIVNGYVAFADVDNDNDQDLLITGWGASFTPTSELYTNDGSGNYTLVTGTPFTGVGSSSISFTDVDGDNDLDVIIIGEATSNTRVAELFTNDGAGNFTLVTGTPFTPMSSKAMASADIDGDNDQDVLMIGRDASNNIIAELFSNDGSGNFTLVTGAPFIEVEFGFVAFADVDGDNDQDVLLTGQMLSGSRFTELYSNDGAGNYTRLNGTEYNGVRYSSIAFADIDGDNDQDVLITGRDASNNLIAELYTNDGTGIYALMTGTPFTGVQYSSVAFADIDGDNDQDVLITGYNDSNTPIAELYTNDGSGNYTLATGTPFTGVLDGSVAFADIDGDNDQDVLITGRNASFNGVSELYSNDGSGNFTLITGTPFDQVRYSSIAFTDVDGDNDQDVLITGMGLGGRIADLFTNDGTGNFTLVAGTPFNGVGLGSIAFGDVDGDNDQDVLITGLSLTSPNKIAELFTNDGSGNFTLVAGTPFTGVFKGSVGLANLNADNYQEILITGIDASNNPIAELYTYDGSGNYNLVSGTPFTAVKDGSIAFADVDGDNDQDVLITGEDANSIETAKGWLNTICLPSSSSFSITECINYTVPSGDETYSTVGTYPVLDTIQNSCGADSLITITLTILPPKIGTENSTICFDESIVVNGTTYDASNPIGTEVFTNIGPNGCDSTVTINLNVLPAIDTSTSLSGVTITANATGVSYQWIDCNNGNTEINGETNHSFTATSNGNYAVIIDDGNCSDTSSCVNINNVGINHLSIYNDINVFPNPSNDGLFTVDLLDLTGVEIIYVYDMQGKEMTRILPIGSVIEIDLKEKESGIYTLIIQSSKGRHIRKLIKN